MRKISVILFLGLFSLTAAASAFVDKADIQKEELLKQIDALKIVKGIYLSGTGNVFFNGSFGGGNEFTNVPRKSDYSPLVQLDINFNAFPLPILECGAIIRLQSDLSGQAFGNSVTVESLFSELTLYRFIILRFGQLYEKLTPFTLIAPVDAVWTRSELFNRYFSEDVRLKHLEMDGTFPLEGMSAKAEFLLSPRDVWSLKAIAAKIADNTSPGYSYDRYMLSGSTGLRLSDIVTGQVSWISFHDITNSGPMTNNTPKYDGVLSAAAGLNAAPFLGPLKKWLKGLGVEGEAARSSWSEDTRNMNPTNGMALTADVFVNLLDIVKLKAGTRYVEYEFVSPGCQTRIVTPGMPDSMFLASGYYGRNGLQLEAGPAEVGLKRNIQFTRDNNDILNFAYAMNEATPNRNGLFGNIEINHKIIKISADASMAREIRPIGAGNADNPRNFTRLEAEGSIVLSELVGIPQLPKISGFYVFETDKRLDLAGTPAIDESETLGINILGAELVVPVTKKLRLVATYQNFTVKGLKWVDGYNAKLQNALPISGFMHMDYDISERIVGAGLIWNLAKPVTFQLDYTFRSLANKSLDITAATAEDVSYDMHQIRALLHLMF